MKRKKEKYENYAIKWLIDKKTYVKESTYANYSYIVYNYLIPNLGNYKLNELNNKLIQNLIIKFHENNLSNKTIKDIIMVLKSSLNRAFNENIIKKFSLNFSYPNNINIKSLYVLSKNEQYILMEYALNGIDEKNLGILISLFCGLRIGEVCALQWKDIDFENRMIHITKTLQRIFIKEKNKTTSKIIITSPKTLKANRDIPITKVLFEKLKKMKNKNDYYILTGNLNYIEPRVYRSYFSKVLKSLDIAHFKYHCLRHTFASNCISLGTDYKTVSELLGHSNISLTLNLYVHPSVQDKIKCVDLLAKNMMYK